ncbi:MAG: Flp family type IVb pilin [Hyphomicrobiaceae bacterium]|nr:Flp family type IVb pilin [Hyphomicrobiaceae bacterium]
MVSSRDGATAIEYGLIAAMISLAIITSLELLGPSLNQMFQLILSGFA